MKQVYTPSLIKIFCTVLILLTAGFARAQFSINLNPDSVFHDSHTYYWTTDQTVMYGFNGDIYMISLLDQFTGKSPTVYTIDHKGKFSAFNMKPNNKNYFLYGFEDETDYYSGTQGNSIAFEYNGSFWHYNNYMKWNTAFIHTDDSYDCFARFPSDPSQPYHAYYDPVPGKPAVIKKGAFQHDSTLYFLGVYAQSSDPNYKKWCVQKYSYDKTNDKFIFQKNTVVPGILGDRLGGIVYHTDTTGNEILILNTYRSDNTQVYLCYLVPSTPPGGETVFNYQAFAISPPGLSNCWASVLLSGSIKGCRPDSGITGKHYSERMTMIGYGNSGTGVINYIEYQLAHGLAYSDAMGSVVLPSSMSPANWKSQYNLIGAYELIPNSFNNVVGHEANGYNQQNWIYYPDGNGRVCGLRFLSDSWKPIPDSTVVSDDLGLDQVSDSTYGPAIRSLWTLTGILDGGPPCSVNWHKWDSCYYTDYRPTELVFELTGEFSSKVSTTTEDQYSLGGEVSTKGKRLSFSAGMKFSNAFKNTVSSKQTWVCSLSMPFVLNEESQNLGVYVYAVPTITRYTYKRFPWYDPGFRYPVANSKEFRFVTSSTALIYRYPEISAFPFSVNNPNASNLSDWAFSNRTKLSHDVTHSGIQAVCDPSWSNPNNGQTGTFEMITDTTSEYSHTTSYEAEASSTVKKPKVFEVKVSAGTEISYETSTENESSISKKVEVSLHNLESNICGINIAHSYTVSTYWFKPEDYNWWFYDSLGTERPWYIAYTVGNLQGSVNLLAPSAGAPLKEDGMLFSWDVTDFEASEYTFYISKSGFISPSQTLYSFNAGMNRDHYLATLPFCENGKSYYWAVRAINAEGEIRWSESRPFVTGNAALTESGLRVIPFPNPGTTGTQRLLFDSQETGNVELTVTSIGGREVYHYKVIHEQPGSQTIDLTGLRLDPGIYILETRINGEREVSKLVVTR